MSNDSLEDRVWLLSGLTGSECGVLRLKNERLRFVSDEGRQVFDAALSEVNEIKFPWLYLGVGATLKIGSEKFRLSFVQPGNTAGGEEVDIMDARARGKIWQAALIAPDEN